jgi:2-(1,2-epoxy-1,2-dihydrophenyl)acetyl-CoA isomerase
MTQNILLARNEGIAILTLNLPEKLNSLSLDAIKALLQTLRELHADPSVRAMVITGAGRGFCAGWQLDESGVPGLPDESFGVSQAHLMAEYFNPVIQAFHELPFPSIAAVNGVCAGAGVSIALAADMVIAAESASFRLTFAPKLGLVPDLGATWKLPRLIGWARAQAVTLLGSPIGALDAVQWGMIYRAVADGELRAASMELAAGLANGPCGVAREVRHAYHAAQLQSLAGQMDYERLRQRKLLDSAAFQEGLRAFQEKRPANFHGARP